MKSAVAIASYEKNLQTEVSMFAQEMNLPLIGDAKIKFRYLLVMSADGLALHDSTNDFNPICVDFTAGKMAHRRRFGGGRNQTLARAIGLKPNFNPYVIDATAGLGRDAFVMASLGCAVKMLERNKVVAALLRDGLARAKQHSELKDIIARMSLEHSNASLWLQENFHNDFDRKPDVIYIDPMYPARNKSALVKKEMRVFRDLVGDDEDSGVMIEAAFATKCKRVVIKRPRLMPPIDCSREPDSFTVSKNTRYDMYFSL